MTNGKQPAKTGPVMDAEQGAQALASGATLQQIQTPYATAVTVQVERSLAKVQSRCLEEARLAAEGLFYGWGAGNDRIEGPSVKCAMIALRNWGNAALDMRPVQETPTSYIFTAAFVDLETGVTIMRQFRQSKSWTVYGRHDEERKADIRFQIGQSKAARNVILNAIPAWLIDKMIDEAKSGVRQKIEAYIEKNGLEAARQLVVKSLAKHKVEIADIERKYETKIGGWDVEVLIMLKGDIQALDDGVESAASLFPKETVAPTTTTADGVLNSMKPGDASKHVDHGEAPSADEKPSGGF